MDRDTSPVARAARPAALALCVASRAATSNSLAQLARGEVDVAAIDCVTYALLERCRPDVIAATRIIGRTASAPGLPYATRIGAGAELVAQLRAGLSRAFADPDLGHLREALLIDGLDVLDPAAYGCMAEMEAEAKRQRYLELE